MMMKRHLTLLPHKIIAPFEFVANKITMIRSWFERSDYMSTLTSHTSSGLDSVSSRQPLRMERSQEPIHIGVNAAWSMGGDRSTMSTQSRAVMIDSRVFVYSLFS